MSKQSRSEAATRCYAPQEQWLDDQIVLSGEEAHHLHRVLRKGENDPVAVLDGEGREAAGRILSISKQQAVIDVDEMVEESESRPQIVLVQSVIRNARMEWLVQKAVELGVSEIVQVVTDHAVVKIKAEKAVVRQERLDAIAKSALKQSGCLWLPKIYVAASLTEALSLPGDCAGFYGSLETGSRIFRDCLRGATSERIAVAVGPEGDFSEREYEQLQTSGFVPADLGNTILRAETAALYMVGAVRYELG